MDSAGETFTDAIRSESDAQDARAAGGWLGRQEWRGLGVPANLDVETDVDTVNDAIQIDEEGQSS